MASQLAQAISQATASAASAASALASQIASAASAAASAVSAAAALVSQNAASASATTAATQATNSANSATTASTQASNAAISATAASTSASGASTSATAAAASATSASGSAATATTQATNAASSATSTAALLASFRSAFLGSFVSDTAAAAFATANSITLSNGIMYENNSTTPEKFRIYNGSAWQDYDASAQASQSAAALSAANAAASASTASTQATNAANSATSAATQATNAATSATSASTSATTATTQATNAATSATASAASATSAASSAASAAALLDNFDDRYLGAKSSAPSVDNDGNALQLGALYFDSTTGKMRVYTASGWLDASSASVATLAVFNYTATAGQTSFSGADIASQTLTYTVGSLFVTLNGIDLKNSADYTATTGSSVVLASGAVAGDELRVYAFGSFLVADTYTRAQADAGFVAKDGSGNASVSGKLGIGTASPVSAVHVYGATGSPTVTIQQGSTYGYIGQNGTDLLIASHIGSTGIKAKLALGAPDNSFVLDSSGRVTMPNQPMFSAITAGSYNNATIVFNSAYVNVGSHLNTSSGVFTAPVAGVYQFSAHGLANGATVDILLKINGVQRLSSRGSSTTSSLSGYFSLGAGDTVLIASGGNQIYGDSNGWCAFSGRLMN